MNSVTSKDERLLMFFFNFYSLGKVNIAIYRFALENDPERVATMKGRTNLSNDASFFAVSKTERER